MITLKTLPQATAQEVFNQVKNHLLTQNKKSVRVSNSNNCRYRTGELSCAGGCLIAEDEYNEDMEGRTWGSLISRGIAPSMHYELITDLQKLHDCNFPNVWSEKLKQLANNYNLNY